MHMPCDGRLTRMIYVPGSLFSVNAGHRTRRARPVRAQRAVGLRVRIARRDRSYSTMVGATIVGSMATVWHGVVNHAAAGEDARMALRRPARSLREGRGDGPLPCSGSTVVLLFPRRTLVFNPSWAPGRAIRLGETMATERGLSDDRRMRSRRLRGRQRAFRLSSIASPVTVTVSSVVPPSTATGAPPAGAACARIMISGRGGGVTSPVDTVMRPARQLA